MLEIIVSLATSAGAAWLTGLLIVLLVAKVLISAVEVEGRWKLFSYRLNIVIVFLLVIFSITVVVRIAAILQS